MSKLLNQNKKVKPYNLRINKTFPKILLSHWFIKITSLRFLYKFIITFSFCDQNRNIYIYILGQRPHIV